MNSLLYDHASVAPRPLRIASAAPDQAPCTDSAQRGSIFGPSCDGLDTVLTDYLLPRLESGDWLVFAEHGRIYVLWRVCFRWDGPDPDALHIPHFLRFLVVCMLQPGSSCVIGASLATGLSCSYKM